MNFRIYGTYASAKNSRHSVATWLCHGAHCGKIKIKKAASMSTQYQLTLRIRNGTSKHTTIWSPEKQSFLYNYADELHPPVRTDAHFAQSEPHIMPMPDVLGPKAR